MWWLVDCWYSYPCLWQARRPLTSCSACLIRLQTGCRENCRRECGSEAISWVCAGARACRTITHRSSSSALHLTLVVCTPVSAPMCGEDVSGKAGKISFQTWHDFKINRNPKTNVRTFALTLHKHRAPGLNKDVHFRAYSCFRSWVEEPETPLLQQMLLFDLGDSSHSPSPIYSVAMSLHLPWHPKRNGWRVSGEVLTS